MALTAEGVEIEAVMEWYEGGLFGTAPIRQAAASGPWFCISRAESLKATKCTVRSGSPKAAPDNKTPSIWKLWG